MQRHGDYVPGTTPTPESSNSIFERGSLNGLWRQPEKSVSDLKRVYDHRIRPACPASLVKGRWYTMGEFSNLMKGIR